MTTRLLLTLTLLTPALAAGQDNPLDRNRPDQNGNGNGNRTQPATRLTVPPWVKPGALITYRAMDSSENDDPKKVGLAGTGHTRLLVMAVLPSAVLVQRVEYVDGLMTRQPYLTSAATHALNAKTVAASEAFWRLPATLKAAKTEGVQTVQRGPFPLHGKEYAAVLLQSRIPNFVATRTYDAGTGLLLRQHIASGRPRRAGNTTGVNLKSQSSLTFETHRVLDLPWFKAAPPAWTKTVKTLVYRGNRTQFSVAGMPPLVVPMETIYTFTKRIGPAHFGTLSTRVLPNRYGVGTAPQKSPVIEAPAKLTPLWIAPQVLANLKVGLLDTDPLLKSTLTYAVQQGPQGKLGVLVERHPTGSYQVVAGYDLTVGVLKYVQVQQKELKVQVTLTLAERK